MLLGMRLLTKAMAGKVLRWLMSTIIHKGSKQDARCVLVYGDNYCRLENAGATCCQGRSSLV